jgi:hypothetical protein
MIRYARQVLVFLEPSKGATNGIRNFLVYDIQMKTFREFVILSLQLQDV